MKLFCNCFGCCWLAVGFWACGLFLACWLWFLGWVRCLYGLEESGKFGQLLGLAGFGEGFGVMRVKVALGNSLF